MTAERSYFAGDVSLPLRDSTIGQALDDAACRYGDREALVSLSQDVRWTYGDLNDRAHAFAAGLIALGFRPGDRLAIWAPNCAEWTLVQFATSLAGIILVNLNPAYRAAELRYALELTGAAGIVAYERFKSTDFLEIMESVAPEIKVSGGQDIHSVELPALRIAIKIGADERSGWRRLQDVPELATDEDRTRLGEAKGKLKASDPINIQFTSGTTGRPKGATLSHRGLLNNAEIVGRTVGLTSQDRVCIPVPLFHCFGMVVGNLGCLAHGATMVYPGDGFDAEGVLRAVESERCTTLYGVPTMFIAELDHPRFADFDLSSLRKGAMGGAPCPISVMQQVIERMHMRDVTVVYGMTETSPVSFQGSVDDPIEKRVSSIGKIQPHLEVKIVDREGKVVPLEQPGEICIRGYAVMIGYWNDPQQTGEAVDSEGWMHTGDLGTIDAEGYANIVGRVKDMIIRGGENIYPREIEEYLHDHPAISESHVVGVPDDKFGEEVCAWIRVMHGRELSESDVAEYCRKGLAHFKVPRHIRFVQTFPMNLSGKVLKREMRQIMAEELGRQEQRTA